MTNTPTKYAYACGAREALMQHAARSAASKTLEEAAQLAIAARRVAITVGRPVQPRKAQE